MNDQRGDDRPTHAGPLRLRDMGSFHTRGRKITLDGLPLREVLMAEGGQPVRLDPNGDYVVEQMYVQYFLPETPNGRPPLLFWHGGGMTGKAWETTPDGREGWLNFFIRRGWDCYVCDAVERGRSGHAPVPAVWPEPPISQTAADIWTRFRLGPAPSGAQPDAGPRQAYPDSQFPPEAFEGLLRQMVPRWTHTDAAIMAAHAELLERVERAYVIAHSQSGVFGLRLAHAMPQQVLGLVGLEPASVPALDETRQRYETPTLIVMGDRMDEDARWPRMRQRLRDFHAAHPCTQWLSLPEAGQRGNTHMLMMDRNSHPIAGWVDAWLRQLPA